MEPAFLNLGCKVPTSEYAYELSTRALIEALEIPLEVQVEYNCCGFPFISIDKTAWLYLAARNIALAEKQKKNIVTVCNGCYLSFREAKQELIEDKNLRNKINKELKNEGLKFTGKYKIVHIVDVLYEFKDKIKEKIVKPFENKKIATHLGCHGEEERGEEELGGSPRLEKMMAIMRLIGIETSEYPSLHECCGAGGIISDKDLPFKLAGDKLIELMDLEYEGLTTICPFCQNQYEAKQSVISQIKKHKIKFPVYYLTQLIGMAIGLDDEKLGLHLNKIRP